MCCALARCTLGCGSKVALTALAILQALMSVAIIVIVSVKFEDTHVQLELPSGLTNLTALAQELTGTTSPGPQQAPPAAAAPPGAAAGGTSGPPPADVNATAGPLHVHATCLLRYGYHSSAGASGENATDSTSLNTTSGSSSSSIFSWINGTGLDPGSSGGSLCGYVYTVCGISLLATGALACLLWCTCRCCGLGEWVELVAALLACAWWLAAALVLQAHASVALPPESAVAAAAAIAGAPAPPPSPASTPLPPSPLPPLPPTLAAPWPPGYNGTGLAQNSTSDGNDNSGRDSTTFQDFVDELGATIKGWAPHDLAEWADALVGLSWAMMGAFAATSLLLVVQVCGCLWACLESCICNCCVQCFCPKRRDHWSARLEEWEQRRKLRAGSRRRRRSSSGTSLAAGQPAGADAEAKEWVELGHLPVSRSARDSATLPSGAQHQPRTSGPPTVVVATRCGPAGHDSYADAEGLPYLPPAKAQGFWRSLFQAKDEHHSQQPLQQPLQRTSSHSRERLVGPPPLPLPPPLTHPPLPPTAHHRHRQYYHHHPTGAAADARQTSMVFLDELDGHYRSLAAGQAAQGAPLPPWALPWGGGVGGYALHQQPHGQLQGGAREHSSRSNGGSGRGRHVFIAEVDGGGREEDGMRGVLIPAGGGSGGISGVRR